jgi:phospho-N-acetylmuramoyl-pentapeptide-transferase
MTAMLITMFLYPLFIRLLQRKQIGEEIRSDGPESHQAKKGTPTMGGVLVIVTVFICVLLWGNLGNDFLLYTTVLFLGFGAIGFADDMAKLRGTDGKHGLSGRVRLVIEFAFTFAVLWAFVYNVPEDVVRDTNLYLPFVSGKTFKFELVPMFYCFVSSFIIVGTANAVNLTDGLDGLAIGPIIVSAATFLLLAYLTSLTLSTKNYGTFDISGYLLMPKIEGVQELAIFAAAIIGAGIGFLWYNTFPASIFMGDVGALALGAALGTLAVFTKNELLSTIIHGIFLMEALSVIAQTTSYKLTGRRVFRMAPIHHHFELKGWAEPKIIVRFWIISIMLALIALASIKIR